MGEEWTDIELWRVKDDNEIVMIKKCCYIGRW